MKAAQLDDRRRLVMPPECPPNSAVTIQQLDDDTWIVKRRKPERGLVVVAFRDVEKLPDDPEWEKKELAAAKYLSGRVPPPEF
jgi:hypothetical protein